MKKAFTLVEVIISIILLGLIVTFIYKSLTNMQISNEIFSNKSDEISRNEKIIKLLYEDILEADEIRITGGKKYKAVELTTNSSIFNIIKPKVRWFVSKYKNTLVRAESAKPNPLSYEDRFLSHISQVKRDCETFVILRSSKKDKFLIYIKFKNEQPIVYEFFKPQ